MKPIEIYEKLENAINEGCKQIDREYLLRMKARARLGDKITKTILELRGKINGNEISNEIDKMITDEIEKMKNENLILNNAVAVDICDFTKEEKYKGFYLFLATVAPGGFVDFEKDAPKELIELAKYVREKHSDIFIDLYIE